MIFMSSSFIKIIITATILQEVLYIPSRSSLNLTAIPESIEELTLIALQ